MTGGCHDCNGGEEEGEVMTTGGCHDRDGGEEGEFCVVFPTIKTCLCSRRNIRCI